MSGRDIQRKTMLGGGRDPEYELKKKRIEELKNETPAESVLLYMKMKKDLLLLKHMVVLHGVLHR